MIRPECLKTRITQMTRGDSKKRLSRRPPLQSTLSIPQQTVDQEWNGGCQIIVTDHVLIMQSSSEALMQGKWVKTQF